MNTKKIRIPNRFDSSVTCWEGEVEDTGSDAKNLGTATLKALAEKADLRSADLRSANLGSADLRSADLGSAHIAKAKIRRILQIGPIGSRDSMLVVWIMEAGDFRYSTGCQNQITEEAFRERVVASHGGNEHGRAYMEAIEFAHRLAGIYAPAAVVAE